MKLTVNKKYLRDVERFNNAIANVTDNKKQIYYKKLFDQFTMQAKIIDDNHNSFTNQAVQPNVIRENVKELQEIRWQLEQLCKKVGIK